ncbi:MAG: GIY-YIG nuclease family protein [Lachnospiraceae bacterium]|nr:GIY-YIG nuclease family protein [Lachnospiraceae bacterium]MDE6185791.1 GIY-YIG nuclease family protein [Lachnospiraceae bacterium]
MNGEKNKENWNLYVLRYNYSGNYYVGTTIDFERRMKEHWRQTSSKSELPIWSEENKSTKGFKFYWFKIENEGIKQGEAEHCENCLAKLLVDEIKKLNKEIHVGNGKFVDTEEKEDTYITEIQVDNLKNNLNDIDKEITDYLLKLEFLNPPKIKQNFSIECCKIGYVGEYDNTQCNKEWSDVETIEFSNNNNKSLE